MKQNYHKKKKNKITKIPDSDTCSKRKFDLVLKLAKPHTCMPVTYNFIRLTTMGERYKQTLCNNYKINKYDNKEKQKAYLQSPCAKTKDNKNPHTTITQ